MTMMTKRNKKKKPTAAACCITLGTTVTIDIMTVTKWQAWLYLKGEGEMVGRKQVGVNRRAKEVMLYVQWTQNNCKLQPRHWKMEREVR
jgi:hypothetical protein